jgi:ABC-type lipoprotein export system ATPase subunit/ABC-type antimicrobial peptide transport system permease subunit
MLELKNITKSYRTRDFVQSALNNVSISFRDNEFVSILGASGSGKTTMLNIIGGLDQYDDGDLAIEGISTKNYKSRDWDIYRNSRVGFIFQNYNLIPHQTTLANVELALTLSGVSAKERKKRGIEALGAVGLIDHIHKLPTQLSSGQMQRVAIARALINDPEIVLADEPTGALDSETSEQVMELLGKIATDRLVIMVTHNPDLAHKYTNRIIQLKDGMIIGDSNPHIIKDKEILPITKGAPKTQMSFLTAISLSVSNLMTKKTRTFITALAGSIGIIGIALILALASGINLYIDNTERETMSAFPLSLDSSGIDITSFIGGEGNPGPPIKNEKPKEGDVPIIDTFSSLFSFQNNNDLKSFKEYLEKNRNKVDPYLRNIQYKYGITPQIYLKDEKADVRQVNPDTISSQYGFSPMGGLDLIAGAGDFASKNFNELPGEISFFEDQYDVVAGKWPTEMNELVVVLLDSGSLTDTTMYTLGLRNREDLKNMYENLVNQENLEVDEATSNKINFDEILGVSFKLVNPAEKYTYSENYKLWVDKSEDITYMDQVIEDGLDLNVVGIVKANPDTNNPMLSTGIYYPAELTRHLITEASSYAIVQDQLNKEEINVFTGRRFDDEGEFNPDEFFNLEDFITINPGRLQNAFNFDLAALDIDLSDLEINIEPADFPDLDLTGLAEIIATQINVPVEDIQSILLSVVQNFVASQNLQDFASLEDLAVSFNEYITSDQVETMLNQNIGEIDGEGLISEGLTEIIQNYFRDYIQASSDQLMASLQADFSKQIESLGPSVLKALNIDAKNLTKAFQLNIDEDELFNLIGSLGRRGQISQNSNLDLLGYRDLDDPKSINLYPKDFKTKESVVEFIDNYNLEMKNSGQEDKVVTYTDFIAAILSSVTTIIDTISYALIAFVGISLLVSSIMIGVITYVSVLERIKEIGILRAIGASKKDIRRVFNAETIIIGFVAGTFGVLATYIISKIANIIVYNKFGIPNIAYLEVKAVALLILISVVLAFISGLIPSSSAANKDPVEALRSE